MPVQVAAPDSSWSPQRGPKAWAVYGHALLDHLVTGGLRSGRATTAEAWLLPFDVGFCARDERFHR
jgi:hypothetical protein